MRDAARVVIYVGATNNPRARMKQHATSSWWLDVDQSLTTVEDFPSAQAASQSERALIAEHQPRHNRAGVTGAYIPYRPSVGARPRVEGDPVEREAILAELRKIAAEHEMRPQIIEQARRDGEKWKDIAAALQMTVTGARKLHAKLNRECDVGDPS